MNITRSLVACSNRASRIAIVGPYHGALRYRRSQVRGAVEQEIHTQICETRCVKQVLTFLSSRWVIMTHSRAKSPTTLVLFLENFISFLPPGIEDTRNSFFAPQTGLFQRFMSWGAVELRSDVSNTSAVLCQLLTCL